MALINKRVSCNSIISKNLNDAYATVEIVANDIENVNTVAAAIISGEINPLYYTQDAADALFATLADTYSRSELENTFATVLNFNTTGIRDNATETSLILNGLNNMGLHALGVGFDPKYAVFEFGDVGSLYGTKPAEAANEVVLAQNYYETISGPEHQLFGHGSRIEQADGIINFWLHPKENIVSISALTPGVKYFIQDIGDSDFTLIGASVNVNETKFTATGPGIGTGTAVAAAVTNNTLGIQILATGSVAIPLLQYTDTYGELNSLFINDAINEMFIRYADPAIVYPTSGASLIGVEDFAGNFANDTVELILAEIVEDYAFTGAGYGASKIGIEDVGGNYASDDVEGALAELGGDFVDLDSAQTIAGEKTFNDHMVLMDTLSQHRGIDVDSATILNLPEGNYFEIDGTIDIEEIGAVHAGTVVKLHFHEPLNIIHDLNKITCPGYQDLNILAEDELELTEYELGKWRVTGYVSQVSAAVTQSQNISDIFSDYGDESDGAMYLSVDQTLSEYIYQCSTFEIAPLKTITVDTPWVIIKATQTITIDGSLLSRGEDIDIGSISQFGTQGDGMSGGGGGGGGGGSGLYVTGYYGYPFWASGYVGGQGNITFMIDLTASGGPGGVGNVGVTGSTGISPSVKRIGILEKFLYPALGVNAKGGQGGTGGEIWANGKVGGLGGYGGGIIILHAPEIIIETSGTIDVSGEAGLPGEAGVTNQGGGGGGGGGAGGQILAITPNLNAMGFLNVNGGLGGSGGLDGGSSSWAGGNGGNGANGYLKVINPFD